MLLEEQHIFVTVGKGKLFPCGETVIRAKTLLDSLCHPPPEAEEPTDGNEISSRHWAMWLSLFSPPYGLCLILKGICFGFFLATCKLRNIGPLPARQGLQLPDFP